MIHLRPYQTALIEGARDAFRTQRRVLLVLSTGGGKTVVFASITHSAMQRGKSVVITAHRAEIVEQISRALDGLGVRHGRIQPGHTMTDDPVQVAMVQTLARRLPSIPPPSLLVIDEAHHAAVGSWDAVATAWPDAKILGVTATPRRLDGKPLSHAFDTMVQGPSMRELIRGGFLADYEYLAPPQQVDFSAVKTRMGDYAVDELAAVMDKSSITGDAVDHYRRHIDRQPAIAFCVTVEHAEHVAQQFVMAGYRAASVDGSMDKAKRRDLIAAIGDGRLDVLTSCQIISEGTDIPAVAGAILLRPTKSVSLHLQMVGRCLRAKPDGARAVILDHVGNVHRHGLPDADREWSLGARKKREAAAPIATCETCFRAFAVSPGWRDEASCDQDMPVGCILNTPAAPRELPEQVAGQLAPVAVRPAWAGGIDLAAARGRQWFDLLRLAQTSAQLQEIATARGYKRGWVRHILNERAGRKVAA